MPPHDLNHLKRSYICKKCHQSCYRLFWSHATNVQELNLKLRPVIIFRDGPTLGSRAYCTFIFCFFIAEGSSGVKIKFPILLRGEADLRYDFIFKQCQHEIEKGLVPWISHMDHCRKMWNRAQYLPPLPLDVSPSRFRQISFMILGSTYGSIPSYAYLRESLVPLGYIRHLGVHTTVVTFVTGRAHPTSAGLTFWSWTYNTLRVRHSRNDKP